MLHENNRTREQEYRALQAGIQKQQQIQGSHSNAIMGMVTETDAKIASIQAILSTTRLSSSPTRSRSRTAGKGPQGSHAYTDFKDLPLDIHLAMYFLSNIFMRSLQGWKVHLGFWPIVSSGSPQFKACMTGDLSRLKDLLWVREASPFDRCGGGFSFLHVSLPNCPYELNRSET